MSRMTCELLLVDARSHQPVLTRGLSLQWTHLLPPWEEPAESPTPEGVEPDSLREHRWGLAIPEGTEGDRLLSLIEPLRRWREAQQGCAARVFRVPRAVKTDTKRRNPYGAWWRRMFEDGALAGPPRPRYLLFLGDLDVLPLEAQQAAAASAWVGRLAFPRGGDYAAYVDKLLRWERATPEAAGARALLHTPEDGTEASRLGRESLIRPGLQHLLRYHQRRGPPNPEQVPLAVEGPGANAGALLSRAAEATPTVLVSLCHGLGAPATGWRSSQDKLALQGAPSLGGGGHLRHEEVSRGAFLPGGVWFHLASLGVGTPRSSDAGAWLERLAKEGLGAEGLEAVRASLPGPGESPFIASLPQAALANPAGPLGVLGHVDLAWLPALPPEVAQVRAARLLEPLLQWLDGRSLGMGAATLTRALARIRGELADAASSKAPGVREALELEARDLASYLLLGDPAARLPISHRQPVSEPRWGWAEVRTPGRPEREPGAPGDDDVTPVVPRPRWRDEESLAPLEEAVLELATRRQHFAARLGLTSEALLDAEQRYLKAGRDALKHDA